MSIRAWVLVAAVMLVVAPMAPAAAQVESEGVQDAAATGSSGGFSARIVAWGFNSNGQATAPPGSDFVMVDGGYKHSVALRTDGSIVAWGWDEYGQATAPPGNDYVAVAAGEVHNIALKADGSIVGWGMNFRGEATPPPGNDFVAIAAGSGYSLALRADGSIVGWGGAAATPEGDDFVAIAAGGGHRLALKEDGSIVNFRGWPQPPAGTDFVAIAAGWSHGLALRTDGSVVGWGEWYSGQITPQPGTDFVAVEAGDSYSLALRADGSIVGWGSDEWGEATPPAGTDFVAIGSGHSHALALTSDLFTDDDGSSFEDDIEWIALQGITKGCNPPANDRFCPSDPETRGQMAAFLHRALGDQLTAGGPEAPFTDTDSSVFAADIDWLYQTGVTKGCNPPDNTLFCPGDPVTRGQMAAFLVRALGLTDDGGGNTFVDDDGSVFEDDIARLAAAGITRGCNPPVNDRFCPGDAVTRGQMAAFLHRAIQG